MDYLIHHGILGMKWGVRRYQNPNGSLTEEGLARRQKRDLKWAHKNESKITKNAEKKVAKDIKSFDKELAKYISKYNKSGTINAQYVINHNRALAELMNEKVSDIRSPGGQVVRFVAKRGEMGVYMALAGEGYDFSKLNNGVKSTGKVGYRDEVVDWG